MSGDICYDRKEHCNLSPLNPCSAAQPCVSANTTGCAYTDNAYSWTCPTAGCKSGAARALGGGATLAAAALAAAAVL